MSLYPLSRRNLATARAPTGSQGHNARLHGLWGCITVAGRTRGSRHERKATYEPIGAQRARRHTRRSAVKHQQRGLQVFLRNGVHAASLRAASPGGPIVRQYRMEVEQEVRAFLAGVDKSAPGWQQPHVLIEDGAPNFLLRDYVRDKEVDLLVVGTKGRSAFGARYSRSIPPNRERG